MFIFCKLFWSKTLKCVPLNLKRNALWIQTWHGTSRKGSLKECGASLPCLWLRTAEDRWLWALWIPSLLLLSAAQGKAGREVCASSTSPAVPPKLPPLTTAEPPASPNNPKQSGERPAVVLNTPWWVPNVLFGALGVHAMESVLTQNSPVGKIMNALFLSDARSHCQVVLPLARKNP